MDEILWHRRETRRHRENKPRPVAAGASGLLEKCTGPCTRRLQGARRCSRAVRTGAWRSPLPEFRKTEIAQIHA
jgi:hypothetical protein